MAKVIQVGWVSPIPHSRDLGYTWINDFCCIVRMNEIKRGDLAVLVEPGEVVSTLEPEFAFLPGYTGAHTVNPVSFFGYTSEALLVPARPGMKRGQNVDRVLNMAPTNLKTGAALACTAFIVGIMGIVGATKGGVITPITALCTMVVLLLVYALVQLILVLT